MGNLRVIVKLFPKLFLTCVVTRAMIQKGGAQINFSEHVLIIVCEARILVCQI